MFHLEIKSWCSFRLIWQHRKVQNILGREFGLTNPGYTLNFNGKY